MAPATPAFIHSMFSLLLSSSLEMSTGDIVRLNRMYNCPNSEEDEEARIADNGATTPESNGVTVDRVEYNKTGDNTRDDLPRSLVDNGLVLNSTGSPADDEDDMILSSDQIDALYSLNAVKRNGLKSAFHYWPLGVVAFEIDPTFRKTFTAVHIISFLLPRFDEFVDHNCPKRGEREINRKSER